MYCTVFYTSVQQINCLGRQDKIAAHTWHSHRVEIDEMNSKMKYTST